LIHGHSCAFLALRKWRPHWGQAKRGGWRPKIIYRGSSDSCFKARPNR